MVEILWLPFLACLLISAILSYLGIHILKREVIFIDIALAQIAGLGAVTAHVAFGVHGDSVVAYTFSVGFTLGAAAFYASVRRKVMQIPLEAVIAVSYAVATAAVLFIVGVSPGGHVHVQQILAGSILWTTGSDIIKCLVLFSLVGLSYYCIRGPIHKLSENYNEAGRQGIKAVWWDFLFYALLGIVVTWAVRIAGVVVVFGFLIIPAAISALLASGWTSRFMIAWASSAIASALGLLFAYYLDFSVGPAVALFLGLLLIIAGTIRIHRYQHRQSASEPLA